MATIYNSDPKDTRHLEQIRQILKMGDLAALVMTPLVLLGGYYIHLSLQHQYGEYVRGAAHTNNIEGFWSHLKRSITGIYHYISPKHTQRYCDASAFRYNTRKLTGYERFNLAISNCAGRLTYKQLIGVA